MRIVHIADLHLGYRAGRLRAEDGTNLRESDGYSLTFSLMDEIIKKNPDIVVIAGDLFHSSEPSTKTVTMAKEALFKLVSAHIPVFMITGNHDTGDIKNIPSSLSMFHWPQVGLYAYSEPFVSKEIKSLDGQEKITFWGVSHQSLETLKETKEEIEKRLNPEDFNILVSHGRIYNKDLGEVMKTEGEVREIILSQDLLGLPFDLVLLGHIHERMKISDRIFYSGSLLRRGFSDPEGKRGAYIYDIHPDKKTWEVSTLNVLSRPQKSFELSLKGMDLEKITQILEDKSEEMLEFINQHPYPSSPILRLVLTECDAALKPLIRLPNKGEIKDACLSFDVQFKDVQEKEKKETKSETSSSGESLIEAYQNYTFSDFNFGEGKDAFKKAVCEKGISYLKDAENI